MDERGLDASEPVSDEVRSLKSRVGAMRWKRLRAKALEHLKVVDAVLEKVKGGARQSQALREVAPGIPRATFQGWLRRLAAGDPAVPRWEKLVDRRMPPRTEGVSEAARLMAIGCRRLSPLSSCEEVRAALVAQLGEDGRLSDRTLRRIWSAEGLTSPVVPPPAEKVEEFEGGGGLLLMALAEKETGLAANMARGVHQSAREAAAGQDKSGVIPERPGVRDDRGRFLPAYNEDARKDVVPGQADWRWGTDQDKRSARDLDTLALLGASPECLAAKFLAMGACHLLTRRDGLDGLDGPFGRWLSLLCGFPYMATTLDKALAEVALAGVEMELWHQYGATALQHIRRWTAGDTERGWLQCVIYVDSTQDPYWTRSFARSSKVSRTGRVQPCLSRLTVTAGPGIPFRMETYAGSKSLSKEFPHLLERVDQTLGVGELGRLVVMDTEMATAELLMALGDRIFVTVLKGSRTKTFLPAGEWVAYRNGDWIREGRVAVHGRGAPPEGLEFRAVEMHRNSSRHPHTTLFVTNADTTQLSTLDVASVYLSRWPHQEHLFRNMRDGLGLVSLG